MRVISKNYFKNFLLFKKKQRYYNRIRIIFEREQSPRLIQYRDEYKQLVATFGLYKGGNATHDHAVFLT